jgi:xanthine dehydrogenase YagS FAD-binding subunit
MRAFALHEPATVEEAVATLRRLGRGARPLGGGTDLLPLLRGAVAGDGMPCPTDLVDLSSVRELCGIRVEGGAATIGAGTTLIDAIESPELRRDWPLLGQALSGVASPEVRAMATLGGNVNQRPRCWFFRGREFDCLKKGGDVCYAVEGHNRYHAIVGGHLCFIIHPSDAGTALLALDAQARIVSADGERWVPFCEYFVGPRQNLLHETVLRADELLADVVLPPPPAGARTAWRKLTDKGQDNWDFTLLSVAVRVVADGGVWRDGRIVLGGVAPVPYRAHVIEEALAGKDVRRAAREAAARIRTVARPMRDNAYKIPLVEHLVERTLLDAVA